MENNEIKPIIMQSHIPQFGKALFGIWMHACIACFMRNACQKNAGTWNICS